MNRRTVRVVLASEHPRTLDFLREAVEQEEGTVVVGEANNASKAVSLARSLRPDVAIVDTYLPYVVGLDDVPLSRIGGLDTAQTIVERAPNTRVVLLNNLDSQALEDEALEGGAIVFAREKMDQTVPFTLRELRQQEWSDNGVVFANVGVTPRKSAQRATSNLIFGGMFFGAAALVIGWMLVIALWLVPAGIYIAGVGAGVLFLSLVAKVLSNVRPRFLRRGAQEPE